MVVNGINLKTVERARFNIDSICLIYCPKYVDKSANKHGIQIQTIYENI